MLKRGLLSLVASLLLFVSVISPAKSAPASDDSMWQIIAKLNSLNVTSVYMGQYGLYHNLYYLVLYSRWVDLIADREGTHGFGFSSEEVVAYKSDLLKKIETFNLTFGIASPEGSANKFRSLLLTYSPDLDLFFGTLDSIIGSEVANYLADSMDIIIREHQEALLESESAGDLYFKGKQQDLRYIYRILKALNDEPSNLRRMLSSASTMHISPATVAASLVTQERYLNLIDRGRALDEEENQAVDNAAFPNTGAFVTRLSFSEKKTKDKLKETDLGSELWSPTHGTVGQDTEFKLRENYAMILASSAVYRPFISYIGDAEFRAALAYLAGSQADVLLDLYEQVKDFKKPIYYVLDEASFTNNKPEEGSSTSFRSSVNKANLLYLDRFIELTEKGHMFGMLTMQGSLQQVATDANSYGYFNSNELLLENELANNLIAVASEEQSSNKWAYSIYQSGKKTGSFFDLALPRYIKDAGTSLTMMTNVLKDLKSRSNLESKKEILYMNAFGDIITSNNLVIVPGASNPSFYNQDQSYNPYTVTYLTSYPMSYAAGNRVQTESDVGKYLILQGGSWGNNSASLKISSKTDVSISDFTTGRRLHLPFTRPLPGYLSTFTESDLNAYSTGAWNKTKTFFSDILGTNTSSGALQSGNIILKTDISIRQVNLLTYNPLQDEGYTVAKFLAENMFLYYKTSSGQRSEGLGDVLNQDFIFRNVLVEGLDGTIYSGSYNRSISESVEKLVGDSYTGFKNIMVSFNREIIENFGSVTGVLGIKNSYQNGVFGELLHVSENYFWIIVIFSGIIFVLRFLQNRARLSYMVAMIMVITVFVYGYVKVLPLYLPQVYNFIANNSSQSLSFKILGIKTERYEEVYGDASEITPDGKFSTNTASINLYRLGDKELTELLEKLAITRDHTVRGNVFILDKDNGMYLEGNDIKVSLDILFANNPVTGAYTDTAYGSLYQIKSQKMFSSSIDYYTPYHSIQDGFIDTLNRMLLFYVIPRNTVTYAQGFSKDSYLVSSYMSSPPFLTPAKYVDGNQTSLTPEELSKLSIFFDDPTQNRYSSDFLNLHQMLMNPTFAMKESLWWKTFEQQGFLVRSIETGDLPKKYYDLVESVNLLTKQFMLKLAPEPGNYSDENLVKLVSLYATMIFNQKVSDFYNRVYPVSINYQDFSLQDVFLAEFQDNRANFVMANTDVINYIADNSRSLTLIFLAIDTVLVFIIGEIIQFMLPVLYILYGVLLLGRLFFGSNVSGLTMGFLKVTGIFVGCLTLFVCAFGWFEDMGVTPTTLWLLGVHLLIIFVLFIVITSVLFNITEMGNSKLNEHFKKLTSLSGLKNLTARNLTVNNRRTLISTANSPYLTNRNMDSRESIYSSIREARRGNFATRRSRSGGYYSIQEDVATDRATRRPSDYGSMED